MRNAPEVISAAKLPEVLAIHARRPQTVVFLDSQIAALYAVAAKTLPKPE